MKSLLFVLLVFGLLACSKSKDDSVKYSQGEVVVKDGSGNQILDFKLLTKSTALKDETINEVIRYDAQNRGKHFIEKVVKKTSNSGLYIKPDYTDEIVFKYQGKEFKGFDGVNYRPDGTIATMDFDVDGPKGRFEVINKRDDKVVQVVQGHTWEVSQQVYDNLRKQITIPGLNPNEKKETGSQ